MSKYAFALGYFHGRAHGTEDCQFTTDAERLEYRRGYDAGVSDYCAYDLGEENLEIDLDGGLSAINEQDRDYLDSDAHLNQVE
jgi:hypothetical protein